MMSSISEFVEVVHLQEFLLLYVQYPHTSAVKIGFIRADKSSILNTAIDQLQDLIMKPRVLISSLLSTVVVQDPDPLVEGAKLLLHQ
jgi:hypothetical protein